MFTAQVLKSAAPVSWQGCRCQYKHGVEVRCLWDVRQTHRAVHIIEGVGIQMFSMHGTLSPRLFEALAAADDIWWLMGSDVKAAPTMLWAAAAPQEAENRGEKIRRGGGEKGKKNNSSSKSIPLDFQGSQTQAWLPLSGEMKMDRTAEHCTLLPGHSRASSWHARATP